MFVRRCVVGAACGVVCCMMIPALSHAQEPQGQAAEATTPLPPVVVETTDAKPKKKAQAKSTKKKSTAAAVATPQPPAAPQQPTGPGNSNASDKTATGPVRDYSAKNTATGTKTDTPLKEIPQSISVVGAEQIRDMGAQSMQEVLRYVPGVVADAYGQDGRTDSTFIRGTEATEFLDGLKRSFDYYTYSFRLDPYFLERSEVLRGPASVLYGQAPVGGIVNSVSKRPQAEQGGEITAEYGSFDFQQIKFDMTGPVSSDGKWSYRLTGLARDAGTQVDHVDDDRYAIQPAITYRPDGNTTITLLGHFRKDRAGTISQFYPHIGTLYPNIHGRHIPQDRFVGEPGDYYDTDADTGTLLVEHKFTSWLKLQHASRYADIHNDYLGTYPQEGGYIDADEEELTRSRWRSVTDTRIFSQDTNLEAKFATGLLQHKVLGGVDYSNFKATQASNGATDENPFNVYDPQYGQGQWSGEDCSGKVYDGVTESFDDLDACYPVTTAAKQTGVYLQDQMRLGDWIGIIGVRKDWLTVDWNDYMQGVVTTQKDEAVSYRAGLMYEFAFGLTPYVSYGESFVPTLAPTFSTEPLKPQIGQMYEAGFKYQPQGANFAINAAVYDISQSNRLAPDPDPAHLWYYIQTGPISIKGFEFEATGKITENLKVVGGYSYTKAEYADGSDIDGNQIESVPKHLASLWGVWEFDQPYLKGWSAGGGVRYIGVSWDETNTISVPAVTLFDAMVAYEEESWRWQITGSNLGDKEYESTCIARGDCFLGQARTIITGVTYKY